MATKYILLIKSVQENQSAVFEIIQEFLGPNSQAEAERLVQEGGTVIGDLNRQAAEHIKKRLKEAGAEA